MNKPKLNREYHLVRKKGDALELATFIRFSDGSVAVQSGDRMSEYEEIPIFGVPCGVRWRMKDLLK